jgi:hypothetical protein
MKVELWAENQPIFDLYYRVRTQWRVGMGGAVGLDYNVVDRWLERRNLSPAEHDEFMYWLQVVESAALDIFNK